VVATLEYLQKGGRIGGASALIGSALQIKPILAIKNGRVEVLEKVRTHRRAMERLREIVTAECPRSPAAGLSVCHADEQGGAERLAAELGQALGLPEIPIYPVGAAITTHAGPGTLAVGFFVRGA
jgi:DegV family protein with EDD domain